MHIYKLILIAMSFSMCSVLPSTTVYSQAARVEQKSASSMADTAPPAKSAAANGLAAPKDTADQSDPIAQKSSPVPNSSGTPLKSADKKTLAELWQSLVQKNGDIQFVIRKVLPLEPTEAQRKIVTDLVLREVSPEYVAANESASKPNESASKFETMIPRLLPEQEARERFLATIRTQIPEAPKMKFAEAEAVMLYRLIRESVHKLMDAFDDVARTHSALQGAQDDLDELKSVMKSNTDASADVETQFTVRRAERDVVTARENYARSRSALLELVGEKATERVDKNAAP